MFNKKTQPVRLEKQENFDVKDFLSNEKTLKIKNWAILTLMLALFLAACFAVQGCTYGFFWY